MTVTPEAKRSRDFYEENNPGTNADLARILMPGKPGCTRISP